MKPQNYSLKFQNSLAESRIIPGSQHGKEPVSKTPKARNGHRSQRKLTKYQQSLVQKKISKVARPKSLNAQDGRRSPEKQQMSQNYATQRAAEKAQEAKTAEKLTGILKSAKSTSPNAEEPAIENCLTDIKNDVAA